MENKCLKGELMMCDLDTTKQQKYRIKKILGNKT